MDEESIINNETEIPNTSVTTSQRTNDNDFAFMQVPKNATKCANMSLLALENMVAKHDNHQKYLRRRSQRESRTFVDLHSYEAECVNDTEDDKDESYARM